MIPRFENSAPIFRVEDMARSLHFYVGVLGFRNADWGTGDFPSVHRDSAGLYICRGAQGRGGAWAGFGVDDVGPLYEHLASKGVAIRMPPSNFAWALEMQVEDPDGNVLRFGSGPE
jgi:catechol 2,3-dioxygenase-like lactoylglutathione lyase family enzyme